MAKKPSLTSADAATKSAPAAPAKVAAKGPAASVATSSTAVRNSPVPVAAKVSPAKAPVTYDAIAYRAFELYQHGRPGGPMDHWLAAETELQGR